MRISDIKQQLWTIGQAYPTLAGLLCKEMTGGKTVGQHWAELLASCDSGFLADVCEEFATLQRPLPEPIDQLAFQIKEEVTERLYRERAQFDQHRKYMGRKKLPWRGGSGGRWCHAIRYILANGPLPEEKVEQLVAWSNERALEPEWMTQ